MEILDLSECEIEQVDGGFVVAVLAAVALIGFVAYGATLAYEAGQSDCKN